jgi:hypothetical protein
MCWRFDILDYGDVFYHMHTGLLGFFFCSFFGLWKSIEESKPLYKCTPTPCHLNYSGPLFGRSGEVRLMPYISIIRQVWRCQICHFSNLHVLEIWYTRLWRCFPPHAHGTLFSLAFGKEKRNQTLSVYGIQLHVIWIIYLFGTTLWWTCGSWCPISFTKFGRCQMRGIYH